MRWFLDMCVILYYIGEGDHPDLNKKTLRFVEEKNQDKFLLCYYIKEVDIPKWLRRQKIIYREILKSLKDSTYKIYSSNESKKLTSRDKKKGTKLLTILKSKDLESINKMEKIFLYLEQQIKEFFQKYIDEFVIPVREINFKLKSCIFTWLSPNDSDSKIITSAVQEHNKKELLIITADKKDWTKELLEEIHNDLFLKKQYPKLPKIKYLQNL